LVYIEEQSANKLFTQLNPPEIYAQSFEIFNAKTANFKCGDYSVHDKEIVREVSGGLYA
jgi:hypothetical protein